MVQAILFDADGVLVDACELHFQSFNRALASKGWCISRAQHVASFNGLSTRDKLNRLTETLGFPAEWHQEIIETKHHLTQDAIREFLAPDPEKLELLRIIAQEGIAIAVCSNMMQDNLDLMLEQTGIRPFLEAAVGLEQAANPKPAPDTYIEAARTLGTDITLCTIVVDNSVSLVAAQAADPLDIVLVSGPQDVTADLSPEILRYALPSRHSA